MEDNPSLNDFLWVCTSQLTSSWKKSSPWFWRITSSERGENYRSSKTLTSTAYQSSKTPGTKLVLWFSKNSLQLKIGNGYIDWTNKVCGSGNNRVWKSSQIWYRTSFWSSSVYQVSIAMEQHQWINYQKSTFDNWELDECMLDEKNAAGSFKRYWNWKSMEIVTIRA